MFSSSIFLPLVIITVFFSTATFVRSAVEPDLKATQRIRLLNTINVTQTPALPLMRTTSDGNTFQPPFPQNDPNYADQWYSISNTVQPRWKISVNAYDFHRGLDLWNESDGVVPVVNIGTGTLFQVDNVGSGSGGKTVLIEHALPVSISSGPTKFHGRDIVRVFSVYNHLHSIDASITGASIGSAVAKGAAIGLLGQTGSTSFNHLHFETRLNGYCSLDFQTKSGNPYNPASKCYTGIDPHVHSFYFIPAKREGPKSIELIEPLNSSYVYAVRYNTTRGHLDWDRIVTNFGTVGVSLREGMNATTVEQLDNLPHLNEYMSLIPGVFQSTSTGMYFDFHFRAGYKPTFIEIYDIYGDGLRVDETIVPTTTTTTAPGSKSVVSGSSLSEPEKYGLGFGIVALVLVLSAVAVFLFMKCRDPAPLAAADKKIDDNEELKDVKTQ